MTFAHESLLSHFAMLDLFSRAYLVGVLCMMAWGYLAFARVMVAARSKQHGKGNISDHEYLKMEQRVRNLDSIESFAMVLMSGCCANQIFGVWFTYMARVTDANPFVALREAWLVFQVLASLIVSLDAIRRYAWATLWRKRALPHV